MNGDGFTIICVIFFRKKMWKRRCKCFPMRLTPKRSAQLFSTFEVFDKQNEMNFSTIKRHHTQVFLACNPRQEENKFFFAHSSFFYFHLHSSHLISFRHFFYFNLYNFTSADDSSSCVETSLTKKWHILFLSFNRF